MRQVLRLFMLMCTAALLIRGAASAHEQAIAFTEVSFVTENPDSDCTIDGCRIEVAHRLVIHDAESTLMSVLGERADLVGDPKAQARFEAYVADRFALLVGDRSNKIDLTLLGGEVERGYYWVYQEGWLDPGQQSVSVSQTVMMDVISGQTNRVNVRCSGEIETVVFTSEQRPFVYRLK